MRKLALPRGYPMTAEGAYDLEASKDKAEQMRKGSSVPQSGGMLGWMTRRDLDLGYALLNDILKRLKEVLNLHSQCFDKLHSVLAWRSEKSDI